MQPRVFDPTIPAQRTARGVVSVQNTGDQPIRFGVQVRVGEDRPLIGFVSQSEAQMVTSPLVPPGQSRQVTVFIPLPDEPGDKVFVVSINELDLAGRFVRELDTQRFAGLAQIMEAVVVPPAVVPEAPAAPALVPPVVPVPVEPSVVEPEPTPPRVAPSLVLRPTSNKSSFDAQGQPFASPVPLSATLDVPQGGRVAVVLFITQTVGTPQVFGSRVSILSPEPREVFTSTPRLTTTRLNTEVPLVILNWPVPLNAELGLYTVVFEVTNPSPPPRTLVERLITFNVLPTSPVAFMAAPTPTGAVTPAFKIGDIVLQSTEFGDLTQVAPQPGVMVVPPVTGTLTFSNLKGGTNPLTFSVRALGPARIFSTRTLTIDVTPAPGLNTLPITLAVPPEAPLGPYSLDVTVESEGQQIAQRVFSNVFEVLPPSGSGLTALELTDIGA